MAVESCAFLQDVAHWLNDFYASVNWSGLRDWISALATAAGAIIAFCALSTWRQQINLQDRYQKIDALLNSFLLCLRAGHDWQWEGGVGEDRKLQDSGDKNQKWRDALMTYRKDWIMALPLLGSDEGKTLCFNPEQLQNKVIGAGAHLRDPISNAFDTEMSNLMNDGVRGIIKLREEK